MQYSTLSRKIFTAARNRIGARINRIGTRYADFSIISNDCWGGAVYQDFGLEYRTPFVGLYLMAPCFVQLVSDLQGHLGASLEFVARSRYPEVNEYRARQTSPHPIGLLNGQIEIQFLHYRSPQEAREKWERRCRRLNFKRLAIKLSADKDGCTSELVNRFTRLPLQRKLVLTAKAYRGVECAVHVRDYTIDGMLMYRRSIKFFDLVSWLNDGSIRTDSPRVRMNRLLYAINS
jgi:uncharacterized protein (DUF1919 family)